LCKPLPERYFAVGYAAASGPSGRAAARTGRACHRCSATFASSFICANWVIVERRQGQHNSRLSAGELVTVG
ncbi:MAG: hypothetical protein ACODAD_06800, partial [Planctomycetota bacterium]